MGTPDLARAVQALREGQLVVYPTDTLYGLGCLAADATAFGRLVALKGLPTGRGVSVLFANVAAARPWARWTPTASALARALLPGALTLVLDAAPGAPKHALAEGGTLALRIVGRQETLALARAGPIVSTSANRHGDPPSTTVAEAQRVFGDRVAVYVDAGPLDGPPSTVVDARGPAPKIIREGAISRTQLSEALARG